MTSSTVDKRGRKIVWRDGRQDFAAAVWLRESWEAFQGQQLAAARWAVGEPATELAVGGLVRPSKYRMVGRSGPVNGPKLEPFDRRADSPIRR